MVQAEFAQGQLDKDDVPIEQICVLSETVPERKNTKYIELLLNIHVRQFMHTRTHTYSVAVYLPGTTPTININN